MKTATCLTEAVEEAPGSRPGRKPRILVVEDDPDMRRLVTAVLRRDGHEVVQAATGMAMLRRAGFGEGDRFDAIVADIQLPDMTALDVLEGLRCRDIETPVVLMTAYGCDQMRAEACTLRAFALLDKPVDWEALRATVRKAVVLG